MQVTEEKSYSFSARDMESELSSFAEKGITEFTLQDNATLSHKGKLLKFLRAFAEKCPSVFLTLPVPAGVLDMDVCKACSELYCTLEINLDGTEKNGVYLFDKKFYSRRAATLNNMGLVFGFNMTFAAEEGDSVKLFRDRLDFALSLYPNHIDFPQIEQIFGKDAAKKPKPTRTFSTQDISMMTEVSYACQTFYSYGRAVPWFLSVLKPLKMSAAAFFQDFSEWQKTNNCALGSSWNPARAEHEEIEKMQLTFLKFKFEEKNKLPVFAALKDIVRLNGAFARASGEGAACELDLDYNPEDILSGDSLNISAFAENVTMEKCRVKVFATEDGVDYSLLRP
ncbi:MAG: hypothetical protein II921_07865 [Treponema sp.]|nr:hypothetical protein [Treponema sp.]